jgi:excisionase family DNA binding protein
MKAEINIDIEQLKAEIALEVVKALRPFLKKDMLENYTLYTVQTLSDQLEVSPQWVYERVHLKEIPFIKIGKFPRFRKSDIDQWLDSQKVPVIQPLSKQLKLVKKIG